MDNLNDLILAGDYFLFFAYAILAYYFLKLVVFKKAGADFKRIMAFFFLFKVVCTLVMSLLLVYYWGVSDNMGFFAESRNFVKLIRTDGSNIKYFFLPVEAYNDKIQFDNNEFELTARFAIDAPPSSKKFSVSGKYYTDSLCIYFIEMRENNGNLSFTRCGVEDGKNDKPRITLRYKIKEDTLILGNYENEKDIDINKGCIPTHYFKKESDK